MLNEVHSPESLMPYELDAYLERGWFRMGRTVFTTNFLRNKQQINSTIWLRILLKAYTADSSQQKIFKRNERFSINICEASVTEEKEELYGMYKHIVPFQVSESLNQLLFSSKEGSSPFNTYEVTVRDGDRLVACGFFDVGGVSAEGISSFYHPDYKKYSMGKFLIYLKINYCINNRLEYFYPGYFVPGNHHFDYKLQIGKSALQFLKLSSAEWLPIDSFLPDDVPFDVMYRNLLQVQGALAREGQYSQLMKYEFFDANFIPEMRDSGLLDFPLLLSWGSDTEGNGPFLVFDVRDHRYHILQCLPAWKPYAVNEDKEFYADYFLMPVGELFASEREEIVTRIILKMKSM